MKDLAALRLYFPNATRANATKFWHRLSAPALANHLIEVAARDGIEQALFHHVDAGFLKGHRISRHHPELTSMQHPQCIELVDSEEALRKFVAKHHQELQKVRAVLFKCELPLDHPADLKENEATA
jgi:PII-like signaling protein